MLADHRIGCVRQPEFLQARSAGLLRQVVNRGLGQKAIEDDLRQRGAIQRSGHDVGEQAGAARWHRDRGFRKRGISRALARAAVDFARERGARAIEGYPMTTKNVILEELHVGTEGVFADAGFTRVSRPTLRRVVMRVDF